MEHVYHRALSRRVLAVVVLNTSPDGRQGDYACYVDAVAGERHEDEVDAVRVGGNKQSKKFVLAIFADLVEEFDKFNYTYRE